MGEFWLFGDAHRALTLHVGVTADGKNVSAGLADVPTQKEKIADHLHILYALRLLRNAHAVDAQASLALGVGGRRFLDLLARKSGAELDRLPALLAAIRGEWLETVCVFFDKSHIQHTFRPRCLRGVI